MSVEINPYPSAKTPENNPHSFQYKVTHSSGASFSAINYGAAITSVYVRNAHGHLDDVVLGYSNLDDYIDKGGLHGAVVGRNANRIRGASFSIGDRAYFLPKNDGPHNLHGGPQCFQHTFWQGQVLPSDAAQAFLQASMIRNEFEVEGEAVLFSCLSPDGASGFPGNLQASVMYAWTKDLTLLIVYRGESDMDTLFNPTNHAYFNLGGHDSGSIEDQLLWIDADSVTNKDAENVPDGLLLQVKGTIFDFTEPAPLGPTFHNEHPQLRSSRGMDQNYCLKSAHEQTSLVSTLMDPASGRKMEIITNSPGLQVYTGNHMDYFGKNGAKYAPYDAVCLETQLYPDSIHHAAFQSPILRANQPCYYITGYRYSFES